MSLAGRNIERTKLKRLLELAQQQIKAIETDDLPTFDVIFAEKQVLTKSIRNGRAMLDADPSLETTIIRIQDADKLAQRLLYQKLGIVMREQNRVVQQERARGAYQRGKPSLPSRPTGFLPDTPTFMDVRS